MTGAERECGGDPHWSPPRRELCGGNRGGGDCRGCSAPRDSRVDRDWKLLDLSISRAFASEKWVDFQVLGLEEKGREGRGSAGRQTFQAVCL